MYVATQRPRLWRTAESSRSAYAKGDGTAKTGEVPAFSMLLGDLVHRREVSVEQIRTGGMRGDISSNGA